jgi:NAD(P)-dependent dehydrogenase (short-subunit alcohol dehydrogenase family)
MERLVLKDRVAWVIGASGAIGSVVAKMLAAEGAVVVASARSGDKLDSLAAEIAATGGRAQARRLDLCDRADVDAAVAEIVRRHGRIDALVNSTSLSIFGDFLELSDEQWLKVLDAKLLGYVRSMRAVLPHMVKQGAGAIVNISGRGGRQPTPAHLPGGSANAGVNLISKGIADAYQKHGIRVNTVAPGPIESERFEKIRASNARVSGAPARAGADRMGRPEDVGDAVVWLLSDHARHVTGALVPVDGGGTAAV